MPAAFETPASLRGATRRRLTVGDGVEIALLDWGGSGPLAILHHANGFCAGVWGLVAERLRPAFRVVALDARGHGDSSKPSGAEHYRWDHFASDLIAVAQTLLAERDAGGGDERVALAIGHSFGGTALFIAAARRTGLFDRIVLVDPVLHDRPRLEVDDVRRENVSRLASAARERTRVWGSREEACAAWAEKRFFSGWLPEALALYAAEGLRERADGKVELKCPAEAEAAVYEQGPRANPLALAPAVDAPTLFLWAKRGAFDPLRYARLASAMRRARVEDVDAGHLVPMERPDLVAESALRFIAEG